MQSTNYADTKALRTSAKLEEMRDAIRVAASAAYRANQSANTEQTRRFSRALESLLAEFTDPWRELKKGGEKLAFIIDEATRPVHLTQLAIEAQWHLETTIRALVREGITRADAEYFARFQFDERWVDCVDVDPCTVLTGDLFERLSLSTRLLAEVSK